jgi:hypothetical protein
MEVLDAMQIGQRKGKPFSFFGCDELIDIDRVNGLLACLIATTVAKRLPASRETSQKDISHDSYPLCNAASNCVPSYGIKHDRHSGPKYHALLHLLGSIITDEAVVVNNRR